MNRSERPGAQYMGRGECLFRVWAPGVSRVEARILSPRKQVVPLHRSSGGYHEAVAADVEPGSRYLYALEGEKERPDPASAHQPEGVHGPSEVIDPSFDWRDSDWKGVPLEKYLLYELHVGTFTEMGTLEAVIARLADLRELGVTAVELMPVAQFPGRRNWGYDGVFPYAVQNSYGGPRGLKILVDACHREGLSVVLDVVYNHLGPEGNTLRDFGPYFTDRYKTPWGEAINFDGAWSDGVRQFFVQNALWWVREFHLDALRMDALHAVFDFSARHLFGEMAEAVHAEGEKRGFPALLIAESDLNDTRLIRPVSEGGHGLDAQWSDDFHHAVHALLTGERDGYYRDFGAPVDLAKVFREGYLYTGQYSEFRKRNHGNSTRGVPASRFVVFSQNHDQIGNRFRGDRMSRLLPLEGLKLAAGLTIFSPFLPLLFMGEEYGEKAPFHYFVDHSDPALRRAVRRGRRREFASFGWKGRLPNPDDEKTFLASRLDPRLQGKGKHKVLRACYKEMIRLRGEIPALARPDAEGMETRLLEREEVLCVRRLAPGGDEAFLAFNLGQAVVSLALELPPGHWEKQFDSAQERWGGEGSAVPEGMSGGPAGAPVTMRPKAFVLFRKKKETSQ